MTIKKKDIHLDDIFKIPKFISTFKIIKKS